ncbi:MAG: hypothetical protein FWC34_10735 [Bacteroidetes bacterium]|nr:hypothetical protein [Bacteroidota bacterium]MCL2302747.1 hypothetical protein [Lentimicrobiaceae bacterium]
MTIINIYPSKQFITAPVWDPQGTPCTSGGKVLYETGIEYFADENYTAAKTAFIELIETYPDDPFAIASLHELFALEQFLDNDYATLGNYYAAFTPADSTLFDVADFLATRCNVVGKNWQPAIDWYENRIENPPSYQDSVFAVIDLGDIHLMMEADTIGGAKSGTPRWHYRLTDIKPHSKQEHEINKATLPQIKSQKPQTAYSIPQTNKKGALGQNVPNLATGITTIDFEIYAEGAVEIAIYNIAGQLVKSLPQGTLAEGSYQTKITVAGMPVGMYHYALFINGERTDAKKMIVN